MQAAGRKPGFGGKTWIALRKLHSPRLRRLYALAEEKIKEV